MPWNVKKNGTCHGAPAVMIPAHAKDYVAIVLHTILKIGNFPDVHFPKMLKGPMTGLLNISPDWFRQGKFNLLLCQIAKRVLWPAGLVYLEVK